MVEFQRQAISHSASRVGALRITTQLEHSLSQAANKDTLATSVRTTLCERGSRPSTKLSGVRIAMLTIVAILVPLAPALADDHKKIEAHTKPAPFISSPSATKNESAPGAAKLTVAVSEQPPFCFKDDEGKWVGIAVELWERVASKLNLQYAYKVTDLVGAVKGMDDHTFDVEAIPAFITDAAEEHMDFSAPYYAEDIAVAVNGDARPSLVQAIQSMILSTPFLGLLVAIAGITLAGALALWYLEHESETENYKGRTRKAFLQSLYWSVSILSGRDFPSTVGWKAKAPGTRGGQIFALVWVVVGTMIFSIFTASAASMLTAKQMQGTINEWSDLKRFRVGTVDDPDSQAFLKARHIAFTSFPTPLAMMTALANHKFDAAVFPRSGLTYWAHNAFNDKIVVLPLSSQITYLALPLQLGSHLRKPINTALLDITQSKGWSKLVSGYLGTGSSGNDVGDENSPNEEKHHKKP